jgi:hypothetical protein
MQDMNSFHAYFGSSATRSKNLAIGSESIHFTVQVFALIHRKPSETLAGGTDYK